MNNPLTKWRYEAIGKRITKTLLDKGYDAQYVDNLDEAKKAVLNIIPEGAVVGLGGSVTLSEMGIIDDFRNGNYQLIDRYDPTIDHVVKYHEALNAEYFVTGTNAITKNGELVNMDCSGNRVAAMIFGPKYVVIVAGANKVVDSIDMALAHIKEIAPINAKRNHHTTPCTVSGCCEDCQDRGRMCNYLGVIYNGRKEPGRFKIVIVGDQVGL